MKKSNPQSSFPVLFFAGLIIAFGGGQLAAIAEWADDSNFQAASNSCDWRYCEAHKMHWPQWPDLSPTGVDIGTSEVSLADDFKCTSTGPIKGIHIWGSFADDVLPDNGPGSLRFELSIYSDIPAQGDNWSRPGELLWTCTFEPAKYSVRKVHDGPEDWYDPATGLYLPGNHRRAYQYSFCIEDAPLTQEEGTIYWLGVKELGPANADYKLGWKTTIRRLQWNDDAVYLLTGESTWSPLTYPEKHEYTGETLGLAFVITGGEEMQTEHDLGDAPDSSNNFPGTPMLAYPSGVVANYPTVYWTGSAPYGPIHWDPKGSLYLGNRVSLENEADLGFDEDSHNNLKPSGDLPDLDDGDDGVQLPLMLPHCQEATFDYVLTVTDPSAIFNLAFVNVWCDWNRDGDWDDVVECPNGDQVPEWAVQDQILLLIELGTFTITTPQFMCWHPVDTTEPGPMWMRITVAELPWVTFADSAINGGSGPVEGYRYGETEDYYIYPGKESGQLEYDWGDAPDGTVAPGYPTLSTNSGANHVIAGPWLGDDNDKPDAELNGQPESKALGDDLDIDPLFSLGPPNDDENGVTIPTLIQGETADITLDVRGGGGIVQAWIDFDGDETWQASEQIYDGYLPNGIHAVSFSVPDSAAVGQTFARFRISRQGGLGPEGPALDGEVEDYAVLIEEAPQDIKWVQWPDLTINGIDIRVDKSDGRYRRIADDFECKNNNQITKVSLWGSWKNDKKGVIEQIHLNIHSDDPVGPEGQEPENQYSKPGQQLWGRQFGPGEFQETLYHVVRDPGEWWLDPVRGQWSPGSDSEVWRIDIYIEPTDAFQQQGSLDDPLIYWLEVQVDTEEGEFGWKTRRWPDLCRRPDHYMDDAVFWDLLSTPRVWRELRYPKGHPYHALETDSIDMAFALMYTPEGPGQPTSRPVSATQCPVVETQCPSVSTQCPAVQTRCPIAETTCPPVPTECPPEPTVCQRAPTQCPPVPTECPAVVTECRPVETRCPIAETKCPPIPTMCPVEETQCPATETRCRPEDTVCPSIETQCPAVETKCPPAETKCPPLETECPPVPTECPPSRTQCPTTPTRCPIVPTQCSTSPTPTQCPTEPTQCPVVLTECPPADTRCPPAPTKCPTALTQCPPEPTVCPRAPTQCPAVPTECPPAETRCPVVETKCPTMQTQCPVVLTECPPAETRCPPAPTKCPTAPTQCPAAPTQCPIVPTQCPAVPTPTQCPTAPTRCPPAPTQCPAAPTQCPLVKTQCPAVETECPPEDTKCPTVQTQCPTVRTQCPSISTQCPVMKTECPPDPTLCPPAPTQCPPVSTQCPPEVSKCVQVPTTCPPVDTQCPMAATRCPPIGTLCPICWIPITENPEMDTSYFPVTSQCPAIEVQCPTIVPEPLLAKAR